MITLAALLLLYKITLPNRAQIKERLIVLVEETYIQLLYKLPQDGRILIIVNY